MAQPIMLTGDGLRFQGNIGSQRQISQNMGETLLCDFRLVDGIPRALMATINHDVGENIPAPVFGGPATNSYVLEYRIQFGTSDIQVDTGWNRMFNGFSASVQASYCRISVRVASVVWGGVASPTRLFTLGGFTSVNTSFKTLAPPGVVDYYTAAAGGAIGSYARLPAFTRALMITPLTESFGMTTANNPAYILTLYDSQGVEILSLRFAAGEKTGYIPTNRAAVFSIKNQGIANAVFSYATVVEF